MSVADRLTWHSLCVLFNFSIPAVPDLALITSTGFQDAILMVCSQTPTASAFDALAFYLQCRTVSLLLSETHRDCPCVPGVMLDTWWASLL